MLEHWKAPRARQRGSATQESIRGKLDPSIDKCALDIAPFSIPILLDRLVAARRGARRAVLVAPFSISILVERLVAARRGARRAILVAALPRQREVAARRPPKVSPK